jgi:hypothetical protein
MLTEQVHNLYPSPNVASGKMRNLKQIGPENLKRLMDGDFALLNAFVSLLIVYIII